MEIQHHHAVISSSKWQTLQKPPAKAWQPSSLLRLDPLSHCQDLSCQRHANPLSQTPAFTCICKAGVGLFAAGGEPALLLKRIIADFPTISFFVLSLCGRSKQAWDRGDAVALQYGCYTADCGLRARRAGENGDCFLRRKQKSMMRLPPCLYHQDVSPHAQ